MVVDTLPAGIDWAGIWLFCFVIALVGGGGWGWVKLDRWLRGK